MRDFRLITEMRAAELILREKRKPRGKRDNYRRSRDHKRKILWYLMLRLGSIQSILPINRSNKHLTVERVPFGKLVCNE